MVIDKHKLKSLSIENDIRTIFLNVYGNVEKKKKKYKIVCMDNVFSIERIQIYFFLIFKRIN